MSKKLFSTLAIIFVPLFIFGQISQEGTVISGTVTDAETGDALPGANVFIDALNLGAAADADGTFRIVVPARLARGQDVVILARFIGYRSAEATVTLAPGLISQEFALETDVLGLDEVVVTGRGQITSKEKFGVSFSKVENEEITRAGYANIVSAVAGKAANVEITNSSGEPGAAAYIRVRGANTLQGDSQPLIVVDGTPVSNDEAIPSTDVFFRLGATTPTNRAYDINPEDIEKIEILKGAAGTAIYGSRAANGVVLITTKSGVAGQFRGSYRVSYTTEEVNQMPKLQTKYGQGVFGEYVLNSNMSWGPKLDTIPDAKVYDHTKDIFDTGIHMEQNLSLAGGNDRLTYYLSASLSDHDGFIKGPNNFYDRRTARVKSTYYMTDRIAITGNLFYANAGGAYVQKGSNISGLLLGALRTPPDFDNSDYLTAEGWHRSYRNQNPTSEAGGRGYDNPFWTAYKVNNLTEVDRVMGNFSIDFEVLPRVVINYTLGMDFSKDLRRTFEPPGTSNNDPGGYIDRFVQTRLQSDHNLSINAPFSFGPGLSGNMAFGQILNRRIRDDFGTTGYTISVSSNYQLPNTANYVPYEYETRIHTGSTFGNLSLDLMEQLYLNLGMNREGATTFGGGDAQWKNFPRASGTWVFTRMMPVPMVDYGKLRFAWGQAGTQPLAYTTMSGYTGNLIIDGWVTGNNPTSLGYGGYYTGNTKGALDIEPELTTETEFGLDLALFNTRLGLEATYYQSLTKGAIFQLTIAPSTGYAFQVQNAAEIENKGIELALNARLVDTRMLKWDARFLYASNNNVVNDLSGVDNYYMGPGFTSQSNYSYAPDTMLAGTDDEVIWKYPVGILRGFEFVRFGFGTIIDGVNIDDEYPGWELGDLYIDEDGLPLNEDEFRVTGDPSPDWTGAFASTLTIANNLTISALVDIKMGGDVSNGTKGALYYFGVHKDTEGRDTDTLDFTDEMYYNDWITKQNDDKIGKPWGPGVDEDGEVMVKNPADISWYALGVGSSFTGASSAFVEDGSYIKLREVALAYRLPEALYSGLGINGLTLRLSARNIYTWTKYTGIDPETNLTGANRVRGIDYFNNPQAFQTTATLIVDF
ncbi:MAG: SusC/RagA family TonB-linked outer membrane protein [Fidelibacterota bacterium]|nr:MAG: SusC/RagA family TonB-linked outer membrane protein [Candidatus Neomarinimicrobiota bacterium]